MSLASLIITIFPYALVLLLAFELRRLRQQIGQVQQQQLNHLGYVTQVFARQYMAIDNLEEAIEGLRDDGSFAARLNQLRLRIDVLECNEDLTYSRLDCLEEN